MIISAWTNRRVRSNIAFEPKLLYEIVRYPLSDKTKSQSTRWHLNPSSLRPAAARAGRFGTAPRLRIAPPRGRS